MYLAQSGSRTQKQSPLDNKEKDLENDIMRLEAPPTTQSRIQETLDGEKEKKTP